MNPHSASGIYRLKGAATAALAVVLLLAGCAQGVVDNDTADELGELAQFQDRIFGWDTLAMLSETPQQSQARFERQHRETEEAKAACMAEQGFTYIPFLGGFARNLFWDEATYGPEPDWNSREFAEIWGFGFYSTDPGGMRAQADAFEWPVDPNQELLDAMSPAERAAWNEAMFGGSTLANPAGCQMVGQPFTWRTGTVADLQFSALELEFNRLGDIVNRDPRTLELDAEWASCMTDAGFSGLRDQTYMRNTVLNSEWFDSGLWRLPDDDPAVSAFRAREIAMALADYDCREKVDFTARSDRIHAEITQRFVDENRAELEAWAQFAESHRQ